jgi:hypothetical protein
LSDGKSTNAFPTEKPIIFVEAFKSKPIPSFHFSQEAPLLNDARTDAMADSSSGRT